MYGIWCDAPRAFKKLDKKKMINPAAMPSVIRRKLPFTRGGLNETVAANNIMAANNKGCASRL